MEAMYRALVYSRQISRKLEKLWMKIQQSKLESSSTSFIRLEVSQGTAYQIRIASRLESKIYREKENSKAWQLQFPGRFSISILRIYRKTLHSPMLLL